MCLTYKKYLQIRCKGTPFFSNTDKNFFFVLAALTIRPLLDDPSPCPPTDLLERKKRGKTYTFLDTVCQPLVNGPFGPLFPLFFKKIDAPAPELYASLYCIVYQIVTLFYTHKTMVNSIGVNQEEGKLLRELINRMFRNTSFYDDNPTIKGTFDFLKMVVDNWFPSE